MRPKDDGELTNAVNQAGRHFARNGRDGAQQEGRFRENFVLWGLESGQIDGRRPVEQHVHDAFGDLQRVEHALHEVIDWPL